MRLLTLALALTSLSAAAWPVDWIHDVEPGREKFVRLPQLDWFEVDDPSVVQVEWMESGELLLTGKRPGRALILLGAEGKVAVWRVRVGVKSLVDEAAYTAAQKACPDFHPTPLDDVKLTVTVQNEACRKALHTLFQTDAFEARHLELTLDGKVLQAQLAQVQEGLRAVAKNRVQAKYVGAGLVLEGNVSRAEHHKLLWEVLRRTLGRFALDDQLVEPEPPAAADAGR